MSKVFGEDASIGVLGVNPRAPQVLGLAGLFVFLGTDSAAYRLECLFLRSSRTKGTLRRSKRRPRADMPADSAPLRALFGWAGFGGLWAECFCFAPRLQKVGFVGRNGGL